jgi:hypothetical protein
MAKRFWRIRGYKKFDEILDVTIPIGRLTTGRLQELLKALAAKEGLAYPEIVGAYVKHNSRTANDLLRVQKPGPGPEYMCGEDPHFVAVIVDEKGDRINFPPLP